MTAPSHSDSTVTVTKLESATELELRLEFNDQWDACDGKLEYLTGSGSLAVVDSEPPGRATVTRVSALRPGPGPRVAKLKSLRA